MNVLARQPLRLDPQDEARRDFFHDVVVGLSATHKHLQAKYFYDERGSQLFEEITRTPEYYPTRTELGILTDNASEIVGTFPADCALVEFGSGSAAKARILLDAAQSTPDHHVAAYVPVDISADFLMQEAASLRAEVENLAVLPVAADFTKPFDLPAAVRDAPRVGFFPGSTIGNFEPHEATAFLRNAGMLLGPGSGLIVGVDLIKDPKILNAAYNDAAGVTAAFNLNLLHRINRELDGRIDIGTFCHQAFFNREKHRIEMHLASIIRQKVRIDGRSFEFRRGETIQTESSYKYSIDLFRAVARGAGWEPVTAWTDADEKFSVHALRWPR